MRAAANSPGPAAPSAPAGVDAASDAAEAPAPSPVRRRRGRAAAPAAPSPLAQELRRRRETLRLSVRQASERSGVPASVICEIERGRRVPSLPTFSRLRDGLGLDAPLSVLARPAEPAEVLEVHRVRLAACLWACGGRIALADLGAALGVSAAAVREQLTSVSERLATCGIAAICDGVEVRLAPLDAAVDAVNTLGALRDEGRRAALSEEALVVLCYIGWYGEATRGDLETLRGEDCESLLRRLADAGLVTAVRQHGAVGRPNRYRLTAAALRAMSVASLEELRERMRPILADCAEASPQGPHSHQPTPEDGPASATTSPGASGLGNTD